MGTPKYINVGPLVGVYEAYPPWTGLAPQQGYLYAVQPYIAWQLGANIASLGMTMANNTAYVRAGAAPDEARAKYSDVLHTLQAKYVNTNYTLYFFKRGYYVTVKGATIRAEIDVYLHDDFDTPIRDWLNTKKERIEFLNFLKIGVLLLHDQ